jgi:hypothetical protein
MVLLTLSTGVVTVLVDGHNGTSRFFVDGHGDAVNSWNSDSISKIHSCDVAGIDRTWFVGAAALTHCGKANSRLFVVFADGHDGTVRFQSEDPLLWCRYRPDFRCTDGHVDSVGFTHILLMVTLTLSTILSAS